MPDPTDPGFDEQTPFRRDWVSGLVLGLVGLVVAAELLWVVALALR